VDEKGDRKMNKTIILVAGYLLCQIVADITAVKIVGPILGQFVPAAAAIVNVLMALYLVFTNALPAAPFWGNQESYSAILGIVPRIVVASIIAELISELIDTEIYHRVKEKSPWLRVILSNTVALPIDSALFVGIAFYGTMPASGLFDIVQGQVIVKALITVVSVPLIYLVKEK
jgi:uncharacterized integral membrane protein (TIGR00697 family)